MRKTLAILGATLALCLPMAAANAWVPDDGNSNGYNYTQDHDDDSEQGTGIAGFTTLITSWYYDHGGHLHSDKMHVHKTDRNATIQFTDIQIRTFRGKCDHPDGSAWNYPKCASNLTLESYEDFPGNWGLNGDDRDFDIHERIAAGSGYQVIDYYYHCERFLAAGCGARNHEQSENALGYIP